MSFVPAEHIRNLVYLACFNSGEALSLGTKSCVTNAHCKESCNRFSVAPLYVLASSCYLSPYSRAC